VNWKGLWFENKRFLLAVGGALAVLLFAGSFTAGYFEEAEATRSRSREAYRGNIALAKDLEHRYWIEEARAGDYEKQEAELRKMLAMPAIEELPGGSEDQLRVKFDQAIAGVWQSVQQDANRAGIRLPPAISSQDDFGVGAEDGPREYRVYHSYLGIVRLSLEALIAAGVREIERPEVLSPEAFAVAENVGESVCTFHGVAIGVTGSWDSLLSVLTLAQKPGSFLQVRLRNVRATGSRGADERQLRGEIQFYGVALAEVSDAEGGGGGARRPGRPRRARR